MLEVITGGMFAGKTDELIRRLERHSIAKRRVALVKPDLDTRTTKVRTHNGKEFDSITVGRNDTPTIETIIKEHEVIGFDEGEFFGEDIYQLLKAYEQTGTDKIFIVAGLDMDSEGEPFGFMPQLMAIASSITKLHAVCENCFIPANISYSLVEKKAQVLVGGKDKYKALCWKCAAAENKKKAQNS
ncbi:MAG: thymidine kinase [Firmicutes bacterium]|nr:thymidine kinase [Bacillota bacterium]